MIRKSPLYVFYSWNGEMEDGETERQMREFAARGITGVFVHARAGLSFPYFGEEWFAKFSLCIRLAEELGMEVGIYDENGWPSGFGSGEVNGAGEAYHQKKLCVGRAVKAGARLIAAYKRAGETYVRCDRAEGEIFASVESNPGYVDLLAPCVTERFISRVHEVYREKFGDKFGKTVRYLFTDEPQLAAPYAWTDGLERIFYERYGYDVTDGLWRLAFETDAFSPFIRDYRTLVSELFHANHTARIGAWCEKYGLRYTGHFACEEHPVTLNLNGGVMNGYRYMQTPGVDALGRRFPPDQLFEQVVSAKNFFGKEEALSETFGCAGWSTPPREFARLWYNQAARGINLPCLHLSAYSMRGIRKRDYPAFFSYQSPWWADFGVLAERMCFVSGFVSAPRFSDILVISPEYCSLGLTPECALDKRLAEGYTALISSLGKAQAAFDVVGGALFDEFARAEDGLTLLGKRYRAAIVSECTALSSRTKSILAAAGVPVGFAGDPAELRDFCRSVGGKALFSSPASVEDFLWSVGYRRPIAAYRADGSPDGAVVCRMFGDRAVWFNSDTADRTVRLYLAGAEAIALFAADGRAAGGIVLDNGYADVRIPAGEILLAERCEATAFDGEREVSRAVIEPSRLCREDDNVLAVDRASYSLNGGSWSEVMPSLDIEERLAGEDVRTVAVRYFFEAEYVPADLRLAAEPAGARVTVNGKPCSFTGEWFADRGIRTAPVAALARTGENVVEFRFERTGGGGRSAAALDSENEIDRNLFTFDLEIETVYLLGDFSVRAENCRAGRQTLDCSGGFVLTPPRPLAAGEMTGQGLWFYRGALSAEIVLPEAKECRLFLAAQTDGCACVRVEAEGKQIAVLTGGSDETDVTEYAGSTVRVVAVVSNRNAFGPHHHVLGDPAVVGGNTYRGVRGFEDEWLESRYLTATRTDDYKFLPCVFPRFQCIFKKQVRKS